MRDGSAVEAALTTEFPVFIIKAKDNFRIRINIWNLDIRIYNL